MILLNISSNVPLSNQEGHYVVIGTNNVKLHIWISSLNPSNSNYEPSEPKQRTKWTYPSETRIRASTKLQVANMNSSLSNYELGNYGSDVQP